MTDLFKNKYRIPSARLKDWDYSTPASYFITICTQNRICYFGKIVNAKMDFSSIGKMAYKYWLEIPEHFPFVQLGVFIVMPNHVHGIITIEKPDNGSNVAMHVETQDIASLQLKQKNQFGPQSKNLASIVRGFKIGVTKNARMINPGFTWQGRFYDHIIRDQKDYDRIREYINNNLAQWEDDAYHPENVQIGNK